MLSEKERAERQREANRRYAAKVVQVLLRFNPEREPELVEKLGTVPNKSGYIKGLMRDDLGRSDG